MLKGVTLEEATERAISMSKERGETMYVAEGKTIEDGFYNIDELTRAAFLERRTIHSMIVRDRVIKINKMEK